MRKEKTRYDSMHAPPEKPKATRNIVAFFGLDAEPDAIRQPAGEPLNASVE
jgi:hypothetical protein